MTDRFSNLLRPLASLWLTLACLAVAAILVLAGQYGEWRAGILVALPFSILFMNLLAALAYNPILRRQAGLLGFHLALAILALLVALDRLMSLNGHVEITEGTAFDSRLVEAEAGPLHPWRLHQVQFRQGDFEIDYAPNVKRRKTYSRVTLPATDNSSRDVVVGDDNPLIVGGYRFYTSFNKGFAPVLSYVDTNGRQHRGSVHLPSYPLNYFNQGNEWHLPDGSAALKLWLHIPEPVYDETRHWTFHKPENASLVLIDGEDRFELRAGEAQQLAGGLVRYEGLRSWMGYTISYNPLMPWMLATIFIGVLCLAWHIWRRICRAPWDTVDTRETSHAQ